MSASRDPERVVDWGQARLLLRTYLRLSLRRSAAGFATRQRGRGVVGPLAFYLLFGALVSTTAWQGYDLFTYALLVHGLTLFAVLSAVSLVAGDVLLSPSEPDVLGFRPVSAATLLLGKSANLAVYALVLASAINLGPMFAGLAVRGARPWLPVVHWLGSAALGLFCAGLLVLLYAALMRYVPRERFERAATWAQVGLLVGVALAAQVLPRVSERYPSLSLTPFMGWLALLPPTWFAALDAALAGPEHRPAMLALGLAGCALTVGIFAVAIGRLAPAGGAAAVMPAGAERAAPPRGATGRMRPARVPPLLARWLRDPVERAAFRLATTYMRHDREVMLRLYPGLAPLFVPILLPLLGGPSLRGGIAVAGIGALALVALPTMAMATLELSSQHAAAEVFRRAPLRDSAALFHGARKAVIAWLVLPAVPAVAALVLLASGGRWPSLLALLPGLVLLPPATLLPGTRGPWVPLALEPMRGLRQMGRVGWLLVLSLVMGGIYAVLLLLPRSRVPVLATEVVLAAAAHALLLARVRSRSRIVPADE